jgi:hypothetical protein
MRSFNCALAAAAVLVACGGSASETSQDDTDAGRLDAELAPDQKADSPGAEAGADAKAGPPDGPPTYTAACTPLSAQTGTAIDTKHGRLDGYLSYVVPQGGPSSCKLGLHSTMFTPEDPTTLGQKIVSELTGVNHVSVFGDGYTQENGCHDVHYENGSQDGALIIDPLSPKAHILFFRFSTQSF